MKKVLLCLMFICLSISMVACGRKLNEEELQNQKQIFYLNREETKIQSEYYIMQSKEPIDQVKEVFKLLTSDPDKKGLKKALPGEVNSPKCILSKDHLTLDFDETYLQIPPVKEILVRAAIVKSLTQIDGISFVQFQINGEAFLNQSGEIVGLMSGEQFLANEGDEINVYDEVDVLLYFANESGDKLVPVTKTIEYNTNVSIEKIVMDQLIQGPENKESIKSYPTINPATKVNNITITDGICYVNLNKEFLTQVYNVNSEVTIYSIVNSLVALNNVNKVQIMIDGDSKMTFRESISLESTFVRNLDLVDEL